MLGNDLRNVFLLDTAVECAIGINDNDRSKCAESEAAGADELDLLFQAVCLDLRFEFGEQISAAGCGTAGTSADQYL